MVENNKIVCKIFEYSPDDNPSHYEYHNTVRTVYGNSSFISKCILVQAY